MLGCPALNKVCSLLLLRLTQLSRGFSDLVPSTTQERLLLKDLRISV